MVTFHVFMSSTQRSGCIVCRPPQPFVAMTTEFTTDKRVVMNVAVVTAGVSNRSKVVLDWMKEETWLSFLFV